jgi:flagellar biosynthesis GTPase FlhF
MNFEAEKNQAKRNLTERLGRKPTLAELLGLLKTRKQKKNEGAFFSGLTSRVSAAAEVKEAAKAAAAAVREKQKMAKQSEKEFEKSMKDAEKEGKKAVKGQSKAEKEAAAAAAKQAKMEAREILKATKELARQNAKAAFIATEDQARKNLTRVLGKAPRVANIRRLASIRHSGVDLSVNDYLKVKNHSVTRKAKNSLQRMFKENVRNVAPEIDVCAQCDMKRFLERE